METLTLWQWQVRQENGRWRLLRWRMTETNAAAWAAREGKELRQVPASAQVRRPDVLTSGLISALGTRF